MVSRRESVSAPPQVRTSSLSGNYPLPNRTITVDGLPGDWQGIAPVFTDPKGDTEVPVDDGSDLKALYVARDSLNLYFMVEFYAPANRSNWMVLAILAPFQTQDFQLGVDVSGIRYVWPWSSNPGITAVFRDVAEFAIPLQLTDFPCIRQIQVRLFLSKEHDAGGVVDSMFSSPLFVDESKGITVDYLVTVHERKRLIEFLASANNLKYFVRSEIFFKFCSHWVYKTHRAYLVNLTFSSVGTMLSNQLVGEDSWKVSLPDDPSQVCAHYFLNLTCEPANSNYFGADFVVAHVGSIFILPDISYGIYEIRFRFQVPNGWTVATQWDVKDGGFATKNPEYVRRGFIGIGRYEIQEAQVGDVTLLVAVHYKTVLARSDLVDYSKRCFEYFLKFLKFPFPDTRKFLVVFAPPPSMCGTGDYAGPSCTVNSMIETVDLWVLPHEMFHILDGIGLMALEEGVVQYYGYKSSLFTGMWNQDLFYQWLTWLTRHGAEGLKYYYTEIWNTKYDLPILSDELEHIIETSNDWHYMFIRARKLAIVSYMLNKEIERVTNHGKSLDNVTSYLNAKYLDPRYFVSSEEYFATVNLVAANNFTEFFNKYYYGNDWLPPTPLRDWFDWYISTIERLLATVNRPDVRTRLNELKAECDNIINLIYQGQYEEAFSKVETVINGLRSLLGSFASTTTTVTSTLPSFSTTRLNTAITTSQLSSTTATATVACTSYQTTATTRFSGMVSTTYTTRTTSTSTQTSISTTKATSTVTFSSTITQSSATGTSKVTETVISVATSGDTIYVKLTYQHTFIEQFLEKIVSTVTTLITDLAKIIQTLFVTETVKDTVVRVEPLTAERGTSRIVVDASPKPGYVNKPVNISGVLYGSWRCIRDGMVVGKPVEIRTGWGFNTILTTDYYGRFSVTTNCPPTGGTYNITATFYEDQDLYGSTASTSYEVIAKIPTTITISYVANRQLEGYLRRQDTGTYLAYKPVKLTVTYLSGTTWQTTTYDLQTRQDGYWSLEFLFYWRTATIAFEGDETYASSATTISR